MAAAEGRSGPGCHGIFRQGEILFKSEGGFEDAGLVDMKALKKRDAGGVTWRKEKSYHDIQFEFLRRQA